jgi:hypothetical protein
MKKDQQAVSRKSATVEQDKPAPSMRGALVLIFITLTLLVAIYILSLLGTGRPNPYIPPSQTTQEQNWTLSPLIAQYGVTSVPVIVINCKYMRVGSDVLRSGDDTERVEIGQALCTATNSSTFCSKFGKGPIAVLNFPECKIGNKNIIYAFHSPSCPISSAQRNVLDAFRNEFSKDVAVEYVCTPVHSGDTEACSNEFSIGKYDK